MKTTNKLTVPDLISIGVFTALYFVLVTIATFVIAVAATLVCALVGGWFGQKMVKKHFVKAGII